MVQQEFLPLIDPTSKFSKKNFEGQQAAQGQAKVTIELNDLDWEDRETVLRLLFSKMNAGEAASNWRDSITQSRQSKSGNSKQKNLLNERLREEEDEAEGD